MEKWERRSRMKYTKMSKNRNQKCCGDLAVRNNPSMRIVLALIAICIVSFISTISNAGGSLPAYADASVSISADAAYSNSSYNNSSIRLTSQNDVVGAPVSLSVGIGYYSSHPIGYGSGAGSRTQMVNKDAATSMSHDVNYAQAIDGETEFAASSGNTKFYGPGYTEYEGSATTHMMVNEEVTNGKVSIGVLQGSGKNGAGSSAWKDPDIEIEEEYIGTYHIQKNMTITTPYHVVQWSDGWLNCCSGGYFDMARYDDLPKISADNIFDYNSVAIRS
jgi:hypothetical protein